MTFGLWDPTGGAKIVKATDQSDALFDQKVANGDIYVSNFRNKY